MSAANTIILETARAAARNAPPGASREQIADAVINGIAPYLDALRSLPSRGYCRDPGKGQSHEPVKAGLPPVAL